jgi:hypothetical protein
MFLGSLDLSKSLPKMTKVVVNRCFGGFGLSEKAMEKLIEKGMPVYDDFEATGKNERPDVHIIESKDYKRDSLLYRKYYLNYTDDMMDIRTHPLVVETVEELGREANGRFSRLEVVDVPREIDEIIIDEYDGAESIHEIHEQW